MLNGNVESSGSVPHRDKFEVDDVDPRGRGQRYNLRLVIPGKKGSSIPYIQIEDIQFDEHYTCIELYRVNSFGCFRITIRGEKLWGVLNGIEMHQARTIRVKDGFYRDMDANEQDDGKAYDIESITVEEISVKD